MSIDAATLVSHIGWTLLHFLWQGALIGCATALALIALRNASPGRRYLAACAGLLLCLAWPALELAGRLSGASAGGAGVLLVERMKAAAGGAEAGLAGWLQANLPWLVIGWAACSAALALRMALGLLWIGRLTKQRCGDPHWQARVSDMALAFGVTREIRLRIVDNLASPITAGLVAPRRAAARLAGLQHAARAARSLAGARDGAREAFRLPGQPGPERHRGAAVLPPGRVVDFKPDPRRTRTDCRRCGGKPPGRTEAPRARPIRAGETPVFPPPPGPGGQRRRFDAANKKTDSA